MRRLMVLCYSITLFFTQVVFSQTLSDEIDALIKSQLPHATVGALVKDAQTGQIIYSKNADKLLSPASNMKLFTAAAALYHFAPGHRFLTTLSEKDHNYYITFSGSPSLTVDNFKALILNLKKDNITTLSGDIILDTARFKAPYYSSGASYDDLGWYYSAPDTAAILSGNAENYAVTSAKKFGDLVELKPQSPEKRLKIINEVVTVSKEQEKNHCNFNIEIRPNNTLKLFGCMAQYEKPKIIQLAIPNPIAMAKTIIKETLAENNIQFKGQIINGETPTDAQIIVTYKSDELTKMISHMLKESDNLYANSLTKQLAYSLTKEGSYKQGAFAIKKILKEHTTLDMTQIELTDGMGTRYNLASPEQIVMLLTNLYNDKTLRPIFLNALPQAGISGTLKDRMKKTKLEKKVFAKTGSMHDISSLSGYIISPNARSLIFSIVINGINKPIIKAKSLEEQILQLIVENTATKPEAEKAFG